MHRGMTTKTPRREPLSKLNHFELRFTPNRFQITADQLSDFETNMSAASALNQSLPLRQPWGTLRGIGFGLAASQSADGGAGEEPFRKGGGEAGEDSCGNSDGDDSHSRSS